MAHRRSLTHRRGPLWLVLLCLVACLDDPWPPTSDTDIETFLGDPEDARTTPTEATGGADASSTGTTAATTGGESTGGTGTTGTTTGEATGGTTGEATDATTTA
ncbi:MAG: hypothetical protein JNL82_40645 [Myxococcales bacterium]|nr:hypothetical protein [Myxococcales bacterium]